MYSTIHRRHRSVVSFVSVFLPVLYFVLSLASLIHFILIESFAQRCSNTLLCAPLYPTYIPSFSLSLSVSHSLSVSYSHFGFLVHSSQSCQRLQCICVYKCMYKIHLPFFAFGNCTRITTTTATDTNINTHTQIYV